MFQYAGAREGTVFGDVSDEDDGYQEVLGQSKKACGDFADLGYAARRGTQFLGIKCLYRVDDTERGTFCFDERGDLLEFRVCGECDSCRVRLQSVRAHSDLRAGFFAGDVEYAAGDLGHVARLE